MAKREDIQDILDKIEALGNEHRNKAKFCGEHNFEIEKRIQWYLYSAYENYHSIIRRKFDIY